MDPISTARYGMMAATAQLNSSANGIASAGGDLGGADYAKDAVNMVEAQQSFKANVDVVKVADSMWQSLLDLQAAPPKSATA